MKYAAAGKETLRRRLDKRALHSDQTAVFLSMQTGDSGDAVRLLLRTGKDDVDSCWLITDTLRTVMLKERTQGAFDYFAAEFSPGNAPVRYLFELLADGEKIFYTARGIKEEMDLEDGWVYAPSYRAPAWAEGAVIYQIFTDRFCNGDPSNDVLTGEYRYEGGRTERAEDWYSMPRPYDICRHYGGDLQGIIDKLDYLQELGVEVLYLNPIFLSPSNHKYDTQDYDHVDPHFGKIVRGAFPLSAVLPEGETDNRRSPVYLERVLSKENLEAGDALLAELIRKAHEKGMRVILDGVFNHCGSFHYWLDRERIYEGRDNYAPGAYRRKNSPYHDFFTFEKKPESRRAGYESWWGVETLPKLNYEGSEKLCEEILRIAVKWLLPPYNADGWRLDVAADLGHSEEFNHLFWKSFREAVKDARPDAVIIAEHYGDCAAWLTGDEWDTVMNYDYFMEPVSFFLTGMEKHSDEFCPEYVNDPDLFWKKIAEVGSKVPMAPFMCSMNQLSNHDHSRFLTRTSGKVGRLGTGENCWDSAAAEEGISKAVMREAILMQMTWPGAPCVYYGDEAGLCGFTDPDNRRTYPWGREDRELLDFTRQAISLRRTNPALRGGSIVRLSDRGGFLSYGRFDNSQSVIVLINNEEQSVECTVPVKYAEVPEEAELEILLRTGSRGMSFPEGSGKSYPVRNGTLKLRMPALSGMVLRFAR